jgi:glutathione S-transferase
MTDATETSSDLILFHWPQSRSTGVLTLLEALGADYTLKPIDLGAGAQRAPDFLAINPLGKVPTVLHGEAVITEQVAIFIYLADRYRNAGLAPALDDPLRGPYLRWMAYYGSCFEPALINRSLQREPAPASRSPYGDYDTMLNTLVAQLERGDYLLGDRCSAVDVLWGTALAWTTSFGLVPALPVIQAYIDRLQARPEAARTRKINERISAAQTQQN